MFIALSQFAAAFATTFYLIFSPLEIRPKICADFKDLKYCYFPGQSHDVLYFAHGFGNNKTSWGWNYVTSQLIRLWKKDEFPSPQVITISFGRSWWINNKKTKTIEEFIVWSESNILKLKPTSLSFLGDSMGGYNLLRFFDSTSIPIDKMALICPAVPAYLLNKTNNTAYGLFPFNYFSYKVISESQDSKWTIFDIDKSKDTLFYVAATPRDHFGFYPGNIALRDELKKNYSVFYEEQNIRHCRINADNLSQFLLN